MHFFMFVLFYNKVLEIIDINLEFQTNGNIIKETSTKIQENSTRKEKSN